MISGSSIRKAIGVTRRDVHRIKNPQPIDEIGYRRLHPLLHGVRQVPEQTAQSVPPDLLTRREMEPLEGLLHRLVGRETGPFVVPMGRTQFSLGKILPGLVQPVSGAVGHASYPPISVSRAAVTSLWRISASPTSTASAPAPITRSRSSRTNRPDSLTSKQPRSRMADP